MMEIDKIADYVDKVYAYAIRRTYSDEEAADLSQEILFTLVRELPNLRDESRFEAWLWGVAANVTKTFRRTMGKQRAMFSYDYPMELLSDEEDFSEKDEIFALLREKIAMLSAIYRDILILYYYDGLSTKEISARMGIPEGTVTWRLSEARRKLKKEFDEMNESTNLQGSALKPVKFRIDIYGNGNFGSKNIPFPDVYINDALSVNILYHCYEEGRTAEDLAKLCGVPAYYVEDRLDNLLKREAIIDAGKGRYRTNFVIWTDKYGVYCEENAEKALLPMMDRLIEALKGIADEAGKIDFYKAGRSENDLFYLYGILAFEHARQKYCRLPCPKIKPKYDGWAWEYIGNMESGEHHRIGINTQSITNQSNPVGYTHTVYGGFGGLSLRNMKYDDYYLDVCEDVLVSGKTDDTNAAALAIRDGYLVRRPDGSLFVTSAAFTKAQKAAFDEIAERYLEPLMDEYNDRIAEFVAGYKKLFPKHLQEKADRFGHSMFNGLFSVIIGYAQRTGAIPLPTPGCYCDVLIQLR